MKRTPLTRRTALTGGSTLRRGKRLNQRSAKGKAQDEARRDTLMTVHLRDGWRCQAETVWPEVPCGGRLDGHEPGGRGRGADPTDPDAVLTICRTCHQFTHHEPKHAAILGFRGPDLQDRRLPEDGDLQRDVQTALLAYAAFKTRSVFGGGVRPASTGTRDVRSSLQALAVFRNVQVRRSGSSAREWEVDHDGRLRPVVPAGPPIGDAAGLGLGAPDGGM